MVRARGFDDGPPRRQQSSVALEASVLSSCRLPTENSTSSVIWSLWCRIKVASWAEPRILGEGAAGVGMAARLWCHHQGVGEPCRLQAGEPGCAALPGPGCVGADGLSVGVRGASGFSGYTAAAAAAAAGCASGENDVSHLLKKFGGERHCQEHAAFPWGLPP